MWIFLFEIVALIGGSVLIGMNTSWQYGVAVGLLAYYVKPLRNN